MNIQLTVMQEEKIMNEVHGLKMNGYILFFGYIFYRINKVYSKITKQAEDYQPVAIISILQTLVLLYSIIVIYTIFFVDMEHYHLPIWLKIAMVMLYTGIYIINLKLLVKRYWRFHLMWKDEPKPQRRLRGWLIVISFLLIFFSGPTYLLIYGL